MIGFHIGKANRDMSVAITEDIKLLTERSLNPCCQIFVAGPRSNREIISAQDKLKVRVLAEKYPMVVHGAYVDIPWKNNPGGVLNIKNELAICAEIGAKGLIVHLGAGATDDVILEHVLRELSTVPTDVILYLEINTAKSSAGTFETPEKINKLFERIDGIISRQPHQLRVGLCIDTAHVYSCGVSLDEYNFTMDWLNSIQGVELIMFHLNDSASTLGSGVDKHQALCKGNIWGQYTNGTSTDLRTDLRADYMPVRDSGLVAVLEWAQLNECMVILERSEGLEDDLDLIANLGYMSN